MNEKRTEKIRKRLIELLKAVDQFPSQDEMFARKCQPFPSSQQEIKSQPIIVNANVDNMRETNESDNCLKNQIDIVGKMQRLRAKFKLLTVQLKQPNLTLKRVMENATNQETKGNAQANWSQF